MIFFFSPYHDIFYAMNIILENIFILSIYYYIYIYVYMYSFSSFRF